MVSLFLIKYLSLFLDPAQNIQIIQVAECTSRDAEHAISQSISALNNPLWKYMPPRDRSRLLKRWSQMIEDNVDDLATLLTMENGKPFEESKTEILLSARYFEYYGEQVCRLSGNTIPSTLSSNKRQWTINQPIGVVGLITPWNFPSSIPARKLAPAIAAGCTAILKPAPETPLSALSLGYLGIKAGLPPGVLNILPTSESLTPELGDVLFNSANISKISFTGSTRIGQLVKQKSGLKRLSLELGGNAPFIIMSDVLPDSHEWNLALDGLMKSKFRAAGQTCVCANRIFVHSSIIQRFVHDLTKLVKVKIGHGMMKDIQLGPLLRQRDVDKVRNWIEVIRAQSPQSKVEYSGSGQVLMNSKILNGHFMHPVILSGLDPLAPAAQEEIFGPVIAIYSFDTEEQVLEWSNNTSYGLAAYLYTSDYQRMMRMSEKLQFGMVGINESVLTTVEIPFGGFKESGYGKEGSELGIQEYLQVKLVALGGVLNE